MISLSGLNSKQREAAEHIQGPVLILAGAGSGKTRTITYRMAHMVANLGIPPQEILAVSFTNKASKEMKERTSALLGPRRARKVNLGTFHSIGLRILREKATLLGLHGNFTIYDTADQMALIREALRHYRADKKFDQKNIQAQMSSLKNRGITSENFADSPFFDGEDPYSHALNYVYQFYTEKMLFFNAIDFDDILHLVVKLFREHPAAKEEYSRRFKYLMVDEYQDTNQLQFEFIHGLTSTHDNICVVGDDDQSIYSFRGADIKNILNFEKSFPKAKVIFLEENYRSHQEILSLANAVIEDNKKRREKKLWSQKKEGDRPLLWAMGDTDHESQVIIDEVVKHQSAGGHLGDIAILYRSNTQAPALEEQLRLSQVPYTIIGGQKFYEKKEVKDLMSYLCLIHNSADQIALRRILNVPNRGIGQKTLEKYLEKSLEENLNLYQTMERYPDLDPQRTEKIRQFLKTINLARERFKNHPLPEAISLLIEEIKYYQFVDKQYDSAKQVDRRKNDIALFIDSADRFNRFFKESASLEKFVEKLLLQDSQDKSEEESEEDEDIRKNEVTLMTLHSSKGLEFPIVYLIGVEEELLPHKRSILLGEDLDEERRLFYVGITRAQEKLVMTYCKERTLYGKKSPRRPSRFLTPKATMELTEQDRTCFGHIAPEEVEAYKSQFFASLREGLE